MHAWSIFRTTLIEFIMLNFVEGEILFKTINTPVTFGIIVVTTTGVETEPFFSKTTVVEIVEEEPFSSLFTSSSFSNKYSILKVSTDAEQITETNALISELASRMEKETVLEGMIMASGFEDAVVTNSDDSYTVMVKSDNFTVDDAAKILGILVKETGVSATNVKISSV